MADNRPRDRGGLPERVRGRIVNVNDESDEFRLGEDTRSRIKREEILVGQLLEAIRGLRRDTEAQTQLLEGLARDTEAQTEAVQKIAVKAEQFDRLVQNGRWLVIGAGLASLGAGALVTKMVDFVWPG